MNTASETRTDTILIVDDNPTNLEVLVAALIRAGYDTLVAVDGRGALEQAAYAGPDAILLDVMMPDMDGFETCRLLKSNPDTAHIPVFFMTALNDTESKVRAFGMGAVDYVTKPLEHEEVIARISMRIANTRLREELRSANKKYSETLRIIREDMRVAHDIQRKLLPPRGRALPGLRYDYDYYPLARVGGDLLDIKEIRPGVTRVMLADAVGHGVQGAMLGMAINAEYREMRDNPDLKQMIADLNQRIRVKYESLTSHFPCFVCDIDVKNDRLHYVSAGHNDALLLRGGDTATVTHLEYTSTFVALHSTPIIRSREAEFRIGDRLVLFSDGLPENMNARGEMFGMEGLLETLREHRNSDAGTMCRIILQASEAFRAEGKRMDDITLLILDRTALSDSESTPPATPAP